METGEGHSVWLQISKIESSNLKLVVANPYHQPMKFDSLHVYSGSCEALYYHNGYRLMQQPKKGNGFILPQNEFSGSIFIKLTANEAQGGSDEFFYYLSEDDGPETGLPPNNCNLVYNFSFEDHSQTTQMQFGIFYPDVWVSLSTNDPDYYYFSGDPINSRPNCSGIGTTCTNEAFLDPGNGITGEAAVNMVLYDANQANYRTYIQQELAEPIKPNKFYVTRMALRADLDYKYATSHIGMYFSNTAITQPSGNGLIDLSMMTPSGPQFEPVGNWPLNGTYLQPSAIWRNDGIERKYLTIGNFASDASFVGSSNSAIFDEVNSSSSLEEARAFLDVIRVYELPDAGGDRVVCDGQPIELGWASCGSCDGCTYSWSPTTGLSDPNILNPIFSGLTTTTYTLTVNRLGEQYQDEITVYVMPKMVENRFVLCDPEFSISFSTTLDDDTYLLGAPDCQGCIIGSSGININDRSLIDFSNVSFDPDNYSGIAKIVIPISIKGKPHLNCIYEFFILECCGGGGVSHTLAFNEKATNVWGGNTTINNEVIWVYGTLEIDYPMAFSNCEFYFAPDAKVVVGHNLGTFELVESHFFKLCDYRWEGILLSGEQTNLRVEGCYFYDATWALNMKEDVVAEIFNNYFYENFNSLYFSEYFNSSGPFGTGYSTNIYGNQIFQQQPWTTVPFQPNTTIDLNVPVVWNYLGDYAHTCDISIENCGAYVLIGNHAQAPNLFRDDVENANEYSHIFVYNSYAAIENNHFDGSFTSNLEQEGSKCVFSTNNSIVRFGGSNPSEGNQVLRNKYAIDARESAIWMENNYMEIGRTIISNSINSMHENGEVGVHIKHNTWNDGFVIFDAIGLSPPTHVIVKENNFNDTYVRISSLPYTTTEYTVVHSNNFEVSSNYSGFNSLLNVRFTDFAQIGTNTFTNNSSIPLTAIFVDNCRDMVLSENEIENFDIGLRFKEVNVRTQFSCNIFENCITGVYFDNATMSNQGDGSHGADNQWISVPATVGLRMDGNTTLTSNINYYWNDINPSVFNPDFSFGLSFIIQPSINVIDLASLGCFAIAASNKTIIEDEDLLVKVYPNPFDHKFTISSHASFKYRIVDLVGKEITAGFSKEKMKEIELNIPPGMYMVIVQDEVNEKVFKLIRQ
jgi:hypothetical protein